MKEEDEGDWSFGGGFAPYVEPKPKQKCTRHTWKLYEGLINKFYYCETCDKKIQELKEDK